MQFQNSELSTDAQAGSAMPTPVERFRRNLPPWVYSSEDPRRFGVHIRPRDLALTLPYVRPNSRRRVAYIALDVDEEGAAFVAEDVGLPWPTLVTVNPLTAHAHLLYELKDPVFPGHSDRADSLLAAVRSGLVQSLGADSAYWGALVQNPSSLHWRVLATDTRYGLRELAAEISDGWSQPDKIQVHRRSATGRNVDLFNRARVLAYDLAGRIPSREEFATLVLHMCELANDYSPALPESEVRSTARSIARWVWARRERISRNRGVQRSRVLGLEPIRYEGELRRHAIEVHQRAGAEYARDRRRLKIKTNVGAASDELRSEGARVTVTALARRARVSRSTVYRLMGQSKGQLGQNSNTFFPGENPAIETMPSSTDDPPSETLAPSAVGLPFNDSVSNKEAPNCVFDAGCSR